MDSLSIKGAGANQTFRCQKKKKKRDNLIHYTKPNIKKKKTQKKPNIKWIIDLNVKHKMI